MSVFLCSVGLRVLCCLKQPGVQAPSKAGQFSDSARLYDIDIRLISSPELSDLQSVILCLFQSSKLPRVTTIWTETAASREKQSPTTNCFSLLRAVSRGESSIPMCASEDGQNCGKSRQACRARGLPCN